MTFLVATMYLVGLLFALSGDLVLQIQSIRYQNQIKNVNHIETISISLSQWNSIVNLREIKLNNVYYDVISHSISGQKVTFKAVKDHFENEIRVVVSQVFNKTKFPKSDKKKTNFIPLQIVFENKLNWFQKKVFTSILIENFKSNFDLKTNAFIYLPQKPPCI